MIDAADSKGLSLHTASILGQPPSVSETHLLLIPSYNSGPIVIDVVKQALVAWQPVWVIIDGSDDGSEIALQELAEFHAQLTVLKHDVNQGKGSAVYTGVEKALESGFTHVLIMDSDGQHPIAEIRKLMGLSMANPEAMILGIPVFDEHAPASRVKGRKISNFWANLETLWAGIGDSLFGFRVYPLAALQAVMDTTSFARRFDFDPEVAVRLAWRNVPTINKPVPVRYLSPEQGGVSHFNFLRDNILLSWMHIRLVVGFLFRLPCLLIRRLQR